MRQFLSAVPRVACVHDPLEFLAKTTTPLLPDVVVVTLSEQRRWKCVPSSHAPVDPRVPRFDDTMPAGIVTNVTNGVNRTRDDRTHQVSCVEGDGR